jgi:Flp pilus assembly protein TadG
LKPMRSRRGSALIEFTLIGLPLLFVLISIFEMARGMWNYHTLEEAVEEGTRFESVRGQHLQSQSACMSSEDSCGASLNGIATALANAAVGLPAANWSATLTAGSSSPHSCSPLSSCIGVTTTWPPSGNNAPGTLIQISATYNFQSGLAFFWPGAAGKAFGTVVMKAYSQQTIQF